MKTRIPNPCRTILFVAALLCSMLSNALGGIRTVTKVTDNNPTDVANAGELRYEIGQAATGDTIVFDSAVFSTPQTILMRGDLYGSLGVFNKNLTIIGPGPANLKIDAQGTNRVLTFSGGIVNISGLTITGGKALSEGSLPPFFVPVYTHGGGIASSGTMLTLSNCWIVGNQAAEGPLYQVAAAGGGVYSELGVLTVVDCIISNNVAQADNGAGYLASGGGIYVSPPSTPSGSPLKLLRSTVSGNVAVGSGASGGGVYLAPGTAGIPFSAITNSTISGNTAQSTATTGVDFGAGGGLSVTNTALVNNTVVSNSVVLAVGRSPALGFAAGVSGNLVLLKNMIVANNQAPSNPDLRGAFSSGGHNLIGQAVGFASSAGDQVGTAASPIDPLGGPLQDNGGLTPTHELLAGSPAIDMGNNVGAPLTDQRGEPRPGGATVDIGAYEVQGPAGPLMIQCAADLNTSTMGCQTMRTLSIPSELAPPTASGGTGTKIWSVRFEGEAMGYPVPASLAFSTGVTNLVWTVTAGEESLSCTQQVSVAQGVNLPPTLELAFAPIPVIATNSTTAASLLANDLDSDVSSLIILPPVSSNPLVATATNGMPSGGYYNVYIQSSGTAGFVTFTNVVMDGCGSAATNLFTIEVRQPPTFSQIPDQTISSNTTALSVPFRIDGTSPFDVMTYFLGSSYNIMKTVTGSGNERQLNLTVPAISSAFLPAAAQIYLSVTDASTLSGTSLATLKVLPALDSDGIADAVEDAAPNGGDANMDGTQDHLQSNVASLPGTNDSYVTLSVEDGLRLVNVSAEAPLGTPPGDFPYGLIQFRLEGLPTLGASVTVTQIFNGGLPAGTTYYKYGSSSGGAPADYYPFMYSGPGTTGAEIVGNTVVLHLTDGMLGDDDWTANGVIVDPGGPALVVVEQPSLHISVLPAHQAVVSWPVLAGNSVLQSTDDLTPPIIWNDYTGPKIVADGTNNVFLDVSSGTRFYRIGPPSP